MSNKDEESTTLGLRRVIDKAIEEALENVPRGPVPGIVTAYNPTKQTVSVQPLEYRVVYGASGRTLVKRAIREDIPVVFLGAGVDRTTYPIEKGDEVMLFPCGLSMIRYVQKPGFVDPGDHKPGPSDMIAVPCSIHAPTTAPVDATVVHGEKVKLGGPTGTQRTIKADTWSTAFDDLIGAIADEINTAGGAGSVVTTALSTFNAVAWKTTNTEVK